MSTKGKSLGQGEPLGIGEPLSLMEDFELGDNLFIPKSLKDEATEDGLELRWISLKKYKENTGFHVKGWNPYKPKKALQSTGHMVFTNNVEGFVIRQDNILAARPKKLGDVHRQRIEAKTKAFNDHVDAHKSK
jgi:hypothetical protein